VDVRPGAADTDADEVDPVCPDLPPQPGHLMSLRRINGVNGIRRTGDRPDLHGDLVPTIQGNEIDLSPANSDVATHDLKTNVGQIPGSECLSDPPQSGPAVG